MLIHSNPFFFPEFVSIPPTISFSVTAVGFNLSYPTVMFAAGSPSAVGTKTRYPSSLNSFTTSVSGVIVTVSFKTPISSIT